MISSLLNLAFQVALVVSGFWVALTLLGLKWRYFRSLRKGYTNLVRISAIAVATWLWVPEMKREGGCHVAQATSEYHEEESWEELEEDGLP